jgi:uncharacterized protein (TIGR03067 family)
VSNAKSPGIAYTQGKTPATDAVAIQGDWNVASLIEQGKAADKDTVSKLLVTIGKEELKIYERRGANLVVIGSFKFKLDASKTPKTMDLVDQITKQAVKIDECIYDYDGTQLRICSDDARKGRPKSFDGKGYTQNMITLQRVLKK